MAKMLRDEAVCVLPCDVLCDRKKSRSECTRHTLMVCDGQNGVGCAHK